MKKSIIALAVAGALVAPLAQADATLYGSLRVKVADFDNTELDIKDNVSRVGIKGSSDLFSGAKAIFQFEQSVDTDEATVGGRLSYIGATGDFGTATIGRQWTPFYSWTATTDLLDNANSGTSVGVTRSGNTLAYITPNLSGFQAAAVLIADDNEKAGGADSYNFAVKYTVDGLTLAASTLTDETDADVDITAVAASYSMGALTVAARYEENEKFTAQNGEDRYEVTATYNMGNTTLLANYADFDEMGNSYSVEVQHQLGKQARVFAAYVGADTDAEAADFDLTTAGDQSKADGFEIGYRVDF